MDSETNPIQVQTPPKDDDEEAPLESSDSIEPFEMDENPEAEVREPEMIDEDERGDEIIVESAEHEVDKQNDGPDHDSPLSSAPDSEIEADISKSGMALKALGH
jgi:hypothetical protein